MVDNNRSIPPLQVKYRLQYHCRLLGKRTRTMLPTRNRLYTLLSLSCLIFSCMPAQDGNKQGQEIVDSTKNVNIVQELTPIQQSAFDALNTLQVSTDSNNRLYSTFANIVQPCYPADTSFVISQSELLSAMTQFVKENCKFLNLGLQEELAKDAVLAQEEYIVKYCPGFLSNMKYGKEIPRKGIWVLPNVLDRRDVILVW